MWNQFELHHDVCDTSSWKSPNLGYTKKDLYNQIDKSKNDEVRNGNTEFVMAYL